MKRIIQLTGLLFSCAMASAQINYTANGKTAAPANTVKLKSEPRFYISIHGGYALALGSTFKFYPDDVTAIRVDMTQGSASTKDMTYKAPTKGLGQGFRFGAGLSYIINDFLNVGLDFDYFRSTISKERDSTFHQVQTMNGVAADKLYTQRYTISYNATLVTISPNIVFKAISRPKFFIYNKVGAIITLRPNSIEWDKTNDNTRMQWQGYFKDSSSSNAKRYEWGIQNPSFGFMAGIGAQFKITEKIRTYAELQFTHVVFVVRNRILTDYTVDNQNMINTVSRSEKEVLFEKNYTDDGSNTDPNQPSRAITQRIPITYVGLQVGLAYRF